MCIMRCGGRANFREKLSQRHDGIRGIVERRPKSSGGISSHSPRRAASAPADTRSPASASNSPVISELRSLVNSSFKLKGGGVEVVWFLSGEESVAFCGGIKWVSTETLCNQTMGRTVGVHVFRASMFTNLTNN